MRLKIKIEITTPSNATIYLSPQQSQRVISFVEKTVFGNDDGGGRDGGKIDRKQAILGSRRWTDEEKSKLVDRLANIDPNDSKLRQSIVMELARELGRTPAAVQTLAWKINHSA